MPYYRRVGELPPKRHTQFRQPDGSPLRRGADGPGGLLLRLVAALPPLPADRDRGRRGVSSRRPGPARPNRPLKPRHFQTHKLDSSGADPILGRQHLMANDDCRISYVVADQPSPLYRNAIGDECVYVEAGERPDRVDVRRAGGRRGRLRHHPDLGDPPDRARPAARRCGRSSSRRPGTSGRRSATCPCAASSWSSSPYCERDLRGPVEPLLVDETDVDVYVQHRSRAPVRPARRGPSSPTPTTRSTSSAGTAACTRGRSRSTTSSRSPAGCTSRRRYTRRSRVRTS